jgi:cbb3-type cytochrome oxidase maturation protein
VSVIYLLMPLAFALGGTAVWAFVRATRAGQFDDLETPAHRILHDDEPNTPDS